MREELANKLTRQFQQQKCLRGEHEAGAHLQVCTVDPEARVYAYGPSQELAICKHCRCLYVEGA